MVREYRGEFRAIEYAGERGSSRQVQQSGFTGTFDQLASRLRVTRIELATLLRDSEAVISVDGHGWRRLQKASLTD